MRLTKTIYIVEDTSEIIDYDMYGNPIYGSNETVYHPIKCEIEPFSNELARTRYGSFAEVTNRVFCRPDDRLVVNTTIQYNGETYTISEPPYKYDKHYEVLIKKG